MIRSGLNVKPAAILATLVAVFVVSASQTFGAEARPSQSLRPGTGSFVFLDVHGGTQRALTVWYFCPPRVGVKTRILFVMHGMKRNGRQYRDTWIEHVKPDDVLLLVPEFSEADFPGSRGYNLGNMFLPIGESRDKKDWSFTVLERLFDRVKVDTGIDVPSYDIYGHSAGGQFVHRLVLFLPEARIGKAIAANAGWYTMPMSGKWFPYGLDGTEVDRKELSRAFGCRLIVLLGEDDTDVNHKYLRKTPQAMAQGRHRLEWGRNFFQTSQRESARLGVDFKWRLQTVPGVGHSNSEMAVAARAALCDRLRSDR